MQMFFKRKSKQVPQAAANLEQDINDWELVDESGECTNYSPDEAKSPYASLFALNERVSRSDFENLKLLGKGASGVVLLVRYKKTGQLFALKVLSKTDIIKNGRPDDPVRERDIMKKADFKFLVKMHYCFQSVSKLFFVLDYMPGGDLYDYTGNWEGGHFDEETAKYYAACVYMALQHLHSNGIVYRDLKPENVLLDEKGNAKLADFGLSKQLSIPGGEEDERAKSFVGTAYYIAPEILYKKAYSYSVDWWSYGVLIFNLLTGENPFYGDNVNEIFNAILKDSPKVRNCYKVSPEAKDLIQRLLCKNEGSRLMGVDIKAHPWFRGFDWDSLGTKPAPNWIPPEDMVTTDTAKDLCGKTMQADSFSMGKSLSEIQQKMFENFTLDNTADPTELAGGK
eukprot:TRINITY_DN38852_c0_g1_i1.p1 TRINITY_DN38852_c0_g1~~TRINITY_DN38852_c0_g1_i1.p1  ORF type:complete len:396 (+),score=103.16 TRINITY_DN38852_c0_g1_i1:46-1233(+)